VLLLPSQLESFGLAALEAMACGVAPVATNTGGLPELVNPGWNGFLENPGDVDAQAARVVELLASEARYAQVSAAARKTAEEHFCSSLLIPEYIRYYEEVLGR
jgi:glycosyltransferase involved in cell wall biosynthesis